MSSSTMLRGLDPSKFRLHRWIYYLAVGLMFAAAALRLFLVFQKSPLLANILLLLITWVLAFIGSLLLARTAPRFCALLIAAEVVVTLTVLLISQRDFVALLFAIPCMQVRQQYTMRSTAILIGITTLLTFVSLRQPSGMVDAIAFAALYFGGSVLLVTYIGTARRAGLMEAEQQALVADLERANRQLEAYSQQVERLAAGRERQRLARELHDSVTQTLFSMTLTTQSALLLLDRDRRAVGLQLERLNQLTQRTLSEMQVLISRLAPDDIARGGLAADLQQHLKDRQRLDGLSVQFEVEGGGSGPALQPAEEAGLFRIAQEALNNIVKHAQVSEAELRLHLDEPPWMEIADRGIGFDPQEVRGGGGVGLESMRERAGEIGWRLEVISSSGNGTRIRVEKEPGAGRRA